MTDKDSHLRHGEASSALGLHCGRSIPPVTAAPAPARISPLSPGSNARHAVDPINACLNYCYACLASQCRQALLAEGLDPTCGFLHADKYGRDSLTYDLMELERGAVDDLLLTFLGKTTLHYGDFARAADGAVTLHPQLTRLLLSAVRVPQARVDGHARWLRLLLSGAGEDRISSSASTNEGIDRDDPSLVP